MNDSFNDLIHKLKLGGIEAALTRLEEEDLQNHDKTYFERYRSSIKNENDVKLITETIKTLAEIFDIKSEIGSMMSYK